jgi:hypothetical protein
MPPKKTAKKKTDEAVEQPAALPGFTAPTIRPEWEPTAPKRLSPFDFLRSINDNKVDLMRENPAVIKDYSPFMIGRGLSYFSDTVKAANLMNERSAFWSDVDPEVVATAKRQHFRFCLEAVASRPRFQRDWFKPEVDETVAVVAQYYGCSRGKAREMAKMHTPEQLEIMRERLNTGGATK